MNHPQDNNPHTAPIDGGQPEEKGPAADNLHHAQNLTGMYRSWFLDYASYVILERAVPHIIDGLKPVQRRILHALKKLDDGRYNKVANVIGYTMQFHPHGDASIGEALVALGQKELLIDTQGNWGNILTGDDAAAPRYIEARLSKFALDVAFNLKTTAWKPSYDGRNKEPLFLPIKFPLLLAQGAEGIAVGLACKILPHNFNELIDAAIAHVQGQEFKLLPDFPSSGMADFSRYNDGLQGGKVKVRARINKFDNKTLVITEIPFGTTTTGLIESILSATEKGKIKIKKIDDNTAEKVEIMVHLLPGVSPDKTIDALYAFTDCEISISPNACVIRDDKPAFLGVSDILRFAAENTRELLRKELEIRLQELEEAWLQSSLEKIFIEKRIYIQIEKCETWESIIQTIDRGLQPYKKFLKRPVTVDDIVRLTEIKIKRISRYDAFKAAEAIEAIEAEIKEVKADLQSIVPYTIRYFEKIKNKYGPGRERRTEIRNFHDIEATHVAAANQKLYVNRKEGFIGTSLRKDEFVAECSDIDDVIVFLKSGKYLVTKVAEKVFVGQDVVHIDIFKKNDDRTVYNVAYLDGKEGGSMVKRFSVTGVTRDKEYDVSRGVPGSRVLYLSANPNGEAETVKVFLKPRPRLRTLQFEFDFSTLAIKGRNSVGNILTRHLVDRVALKEKGISTLGGRDIWFDPVVIRINAENRGVYLGNFSGDDQVVTLTRAGYFQLHTFDLSIHFDDDTLLIEKYDPEKIYSTVYFDGESGFYFLKRFQVGPTERRVHFIGENPGSKVIAVSNDESAHFEVVFGGRSRKKPPEIIDAAEFIGIKSHKAHGKRLTTATVEAVTLLVQPGKEEEPPAGPEPEPEPEPGSEPQSEPGQENNEKPRQKAFTFPD